MMRRDDKADMDSYRGFDEDTAWAAPADDEPAIERPPEIGVDERRMHVRAYNHWVSLLDGRPFPSIDDLDPASIEDFGPNSVLLDFTGGSDDPKIAFLGGEIRRECDLGLGIKYISQVPTRSLLSRLTDHYLQIIANSAPIGFEAEFVSHRGVNTLYRGILMPLSSSGEEIDFIFGVINWKELADSAAAAELAGEVGRAAAAAPEPAPCPVWADGPSAIPEEEPETGPTAESGDPKLGLWPDAETPDETDEAGADMDAGLGDRLSLARDSAEAARSADQRSRAALYRALGHAYDFAIAAEAEPDDFAEMLEDAGIKAQPRAPMTPVVKLVFGAGYDKTRIAEFAAVLGWARAEAIPQGGLCARIEASEGGLKAIVRAARACRRPAPRPDAAEAARERLRSAPALAYIDVEAAPGEFVLLVARRDEAGRLAIVAPVSGDDALMDRALRRAA